MPTKPSHQIEINDTVKQTMPKPRGNSHTTLTETATDVVKVLERQPGIKMIAPGIIDSRRSGPRYITVVYTSGGFELIISGQGVQKVSVHLTTPDQAKILIEKMQSDKNLRLFEWNQRNRKPGI